MNTLSQNAQAALKAIAHLNKFTDGIAKERIEAEMPELAASGDSFASIWKELKQSGAIFMVDEGKEGLPPLYNVSDPN